MTKKITLDEALTFHTLKGCKFLDWNKMYEKAEQDMMTLQRLLANNSKDKNVVAVIETYRKQLDEMVKLRDSWLLQLDYKPYEADYRVVILVEKIDYE